MRYRTFGKTGIKVSALGFGCMRFPVLEDGSIHEEEAISMLRHAIDEGVNYVDTAYPYHGGNSELVVGKALKDGYREKIYLADKCPVWLLKEEEDFDRYLDEQLKKLQTDHIDFYLLHALTRDRFETAVKKFHLVDKMKAAREEGKIRYLGFSFHDEVDVFKEIVDYTPDWDFCQIQYNYINVNDQAGTEGLLYAADKGLAVIIMEPLLGGRLANLSSHVAEKFSGEKTAVEHALDFLWDKEQVSLLLSGMSERKQVEDNLTYAKRSSVGMLSDKEREAYKAAKEIYDNMSMVNCTACAYCMPCPFGLNIPEIFKAYNVFGLEGKNGAKKAYDSLEVKADMCKSCHHCEKECPQHIKISQVMKDVVKIME
ncbi:MAG: aldo/keto reductase [Hungatella sp.]|nr:aldo/keto reductase [Hungatella sp.]